MTQRRHVKRYPDRSSCLTALRNYQWLASLDILRVPRLLAADSHHLTFEHVAGRHAQPSDLEAIARQLGAAHGAAHAAELHHAWLGSPYRTRAGNTLPGFPDQRMSAILRELRSGTVPSPTLTEAHAVELITSSLGQPAAFYKDANPRNFIITADGPAAVDFDDLTLAPFGYDLAKLLVTTSMTHGPIPAGRIGAAVNSYNAAVAAHTAGAIAVTYTQVLGWAEIHHILTSRYLGQGGYRHSWPSIRPSPPQGER